MACDRPVKVYDPHIDKIIEVVPVKVWVLAPRGKKGVKIGLFKCPVTGRYFRAKVPEDYPVCG